MKEKRKHRMKGIIRAACSMAAMFILFGVAPLRVEASALTGNSNITWTSDGKAFTTDAGEPGYAEYAKGYTVVTGSTSSKEELLIGQHYYESNRTGDVPIEKWVASYIPGNCIHNAYPKEDVDWHGLIFGRQCCMGNYKTGWIGTCADCGQEIHMLFYMDKETAESVKCLPAGYDYYYLCPQCNNLEQGATISHRCQNEISWNKYTIIYNRNKGTGYMEKSLFMYNNATSYDGNPITPETKLKKCTFYREGFEFMGWNTKPDGSGDSLTDGQEIRNLTAVDNAKITLYAQWKKSESTLRIDPAGGSYEGRSGITAVTQGYSSTLQVPGNKITPPRGNRVQFVTNGGTAVPDMYTVKYFLYWLQSNPFYGRMEGESYRYLGAGGVSDTITACYGNRPLVLPSTEKPGVSFGGWYKNPECTVPVGKAGEEIIVTEDTVLYAKWVELVLNAADNYSAYGGSGAVDLSWVQADSLQKTYRLYQSRDGVNWQRLAFNGAADSLIEVKESFGATKSQRTYTVPHSGLYTLTAIGAQGTGYGDYAGGKGGKVCASVWLTKGEVLTYAVGTTDGYNGGGGGSVYGTGGGMTSVSSDQKGLLLVAGGGGGASPAGNGGAGGSSASLRADKKGAGAGGHAGGGGGYVGGNGGELIVHNHTDSCYHVENTAYTFADFAGYANNKWSDISNYSGIDTDRGTGLRGYTYPKDDKDCYFDINIGSQTQLIPVNHNTTLSIPYYLYNWDKNVDNESYIAVYNQDGTELTKLVLHSGWQNINNDMVSTTYRYENYTNYLTIQGTLKLDLPEGTTGVYVRAYEKFWGQCWAELRLNGIVFSGGSTKTKICGYEEGQVISSKPAYGGSNYINTAYCTLKEDAAGTGTGNGSFGLYLSSADYVDSVSLSDVAAKDMAAPDKIDTGSIVKTPAGGEAVQVLWNAPRDFGTQYLHRAESYNAATGSKLCDSNITSNTLTSGIAGYYYRTDAWSGTAAGREDAFTTANSLTILLTADEQYLHVAAVDVSGNLSETVHIRLGHKDTDVAWKLFTKQLSVRGHDDNVYAGADTWYVRADGKTPFVMEFDASMEHEALESYQINSMILTATKESDGSCQRHEVYTPSIALVDNEVVSKAGELEKSTSGLPLFADAAYTVTTRSNRCRDMNLVQNFTLAPEHDGESFAVTPSAGADYKGDVVYSVWEEDVLHGIRLTGDAKAPMVQGTELLESLAGQDIDRDSGAVLLDLTCTDEGSGVREFYMEVSNLDNYITESFQADGDGHLRVDLTAEDKPVFNGDFTMTIHAVDNVGNDSELTYSTCEFSLDAYVTRMLEPHDPVFRRGESGILHITATGYVDWIQVEVIDPLFPEGKAYRYSSPAYIQKEEERFFIPLDAPEKTYRITVRAFKDGKCLTAYPELGVLDVSGTVLDDFRRKIMWD